MKFKIKKDSKKGVQTENILNDIQLAFEKSRDLVIDLGGVEFRKHNRVVSGGVKSVSFEEKPNPKIWQSVGKDEGYIPKLNNKNGKQIAKLIDQLPRVMFSDVNKIMGMKDDSKSIGISKSEEFFLISMTDGWDFVPNEDVTEITYSEWAELNTPL